MIPVVLDLFSCGFEVAPRLVKLDGAGDAGPAPTYVEFSASGRFVYEMAVPFPTAHAPVVVMDTHTWVTSRIDGDIVAFAPAGAFEGRALVRKGIW